MCIKCCWMISMYDVYRTAWNKKICLWKQLTDNNYLHWCKFLLDCARDMLIGNSILCMLQLQDDRSRFWLRYFVKTNSTAANGYGRSGEATKGSSALLRLISVFNERLWRPSTDISDFARQRDVFIEWVARVSGDQCLMRLWLTVTASSHCSNARRPAASRSVSSLLNGRRWLNLPPQQRPTRDATCAAIVVVISLLLPALRRGIKWSALIHDLIIVVNEKNAFDFLAMNLDPGTL